MYEVTYKNPAFPRDEEVELHGLGLVKNGGTLKVDKEMEATFVATTGQSLKDYFKGSDQVSIKGTSEVGSKGSDT